MAGIKNEPLFISVLSLVFSLGSLIVAISANKEASLANQIAIEPSLDMFVNTGAAELSIKGIDLIIRNTGTTDVKDITIKWASFSNYDPKAILCDDYILNTKRLNVSYQVTCWIGLDSILMAPEVLSDPYYSKKYFIGVKLGYRRISDYKYFSTTSYILVVPTKNGLEPKKASGLLGDEFFKAKEKLDSYLSF